MLCSGSNSQFGLDRCRGMKEGIPFVPIAAVYFSALIPVYLLPITPIDMCVKSDLHCIGSCLKSMILLVIAYASGSSSVPPSLHLFSTVWWFCLGILT